MARFGFHERRHGGRAARHGLGAAFAEGAACAFLRRGGNVALEDDAAALPFLRRIGDVLDVPADMRTTSNRLNWNEKYFDFNLIDQNFYTNLVYIESFRKRYYYFPSLNDGSSTETRKGSISIGYKKIINSNLSFDTKATYDRIYRRNIYNIITPNFNGIETYHVAKFQIQSDVLWKINPFVDITSGLDVHSILENLNEGDVPLGGSPNYRFYNIHPNDRSNLLTGYIQTEIKKIPKLLIVAGIRVEKQFGYQLLYHYDLALTTDTIYKGVREGEQLNFFPDWL